LLVFELLLQPDWYTHHFAPPVVFSLARSISLVPVAAVRNSNFGEGFGRV
jgi:hypothetical protein